MAGAVTLTAAMLLLVYTVVEAPDVGWGSARTVGSFAAVAAILAAFVAIERRTAVPLVRLGILRSASLVQANVAAMLLIGGWFGFQFIATLYMQQLRGWSPLETGLAIFPGGLLVAVLAPRIAPLVMRFGVRRLITAGLASTAIGYALFLPIGLDSSYAAAILPTMIFAGLRLRARLRAAQHRGHERRTRTGAGTGERARADLVPVRRRVRARGHDRRQ